MVENETDIMATLWAVITELSEQLNQNRALAVSLYAQASGIKTQAFHTQTGFVLRRFNLDKSKEEYEGELDRINSAMISENMSLQHDNKQLNGLIKEYEQTLDTLMSKYLLVAASNCQAPLGTGPRTSRSANSIWSATMNQSYWPEKRTRRPISSRRL